MCVNGQPTGALPAGMTNPIYDYNHDGGCAAITGGAFVPNGVWPAAFDGTYIYARLRVRTDLHAEQASRRRVRVDGLRDR